MEVLLLLCAPDSCWRLFTLYFPNFRKLSSIHPDEVLDTVKGVQNNDQIHNKALKLASFAAEWKLKQLVLMMKPSKPICEPISYTPIYLLNIISKVINYNLLYLIIDSGSFLSNRQFGFRQGRSAVDATKVCGSRHQEYIQLCQVEPYHRSSHRGTNAKLHIY